MKKIIDPLDILDIIPNDEKTKARFCEVYDALVDATEDPHIARSYDKSRLLSRLLDLFEYMRGEDDESPLEEWFAPRNEF